MSVLVKTPTDFRGQNQYTKSGSPEGQPWGPVSTLWVGSTLLLFLPV